MSARRLDVFIMRTDERVRPTWRMYCPAVQLGNAHRMARVLESSGEQVRLCTPALGCIVYQSRESGSAS